MSNKVDAKNNTITSSDTNTETHSYSNKSKLYAQNHELYAQNQELAAMNRELLESQNMLFKITEEMQDALDQIIMCREILEMQQTGIVAYDVKTSKIIFINKAAKEILGLKPYINFAKISIDGIHALINVEDEDGDLATLPIAYPDGEHPDNLEGKVIHADGSVHYVNIATKKTGVQKGKSFIIDIINDITELHTINDKLTDAYYNVNNQWNNSQNALAYFADFVYHVDLTTGTMLESYVTTNPDTGLNILEGKLPEAPCSYDSYVDIVTKTMDVEILHFNGNIGHSWNSSTLLDAFYTGSSKCEAEYHCHINDTYHRVLAVNSVDPATCHVIATVYGNDITAQKKQLMENERLIEQAHEEAEKANEQLEQKQAEIDYQQMVLMNSYNELVRYDAINQGLQSIFNICYYIDLKNNNINEIKSNHTIRTLINTNLGIREALNGYINADVKPKYTDMVLDFLDGDNIIDIYRRLKKMPYLTLEYETYSTGWVRDYLIPAQFTSDSTINHLIFIRQNIDEEKRRSQQLQHIAETDGLTGLLNRYSGEEKIKTYIAEKKPGVFCILDCDKFKSINDNYGHSTGDKVLIGVADAMKNTLGEDAIVFRLGGDEFAFYLLNCNTNAEMDSRIDAFFNLVDSLEIPQLNGRKVSVSVGAAIYLGQSDDMTFESLYDIADGHLYESKKIAGNHISSEVIS